MNGAVCTALQLAIKRQLYPGPARLLRNFVFADLRPLQEPRLDNAAMGANFSMMRFTSRLDPTANFWLQARSISEQMNAAMKTDDRFFNHLLSNAMMRMMLRAPSMRLGHSGLSYLGTHRLQTQYDGLRLTGLRAFVSGNPQGPEFAAMASLFEGKLWLDITYLDAELSISQADNIASDILSILVEATGSA